MKYYNINGNLIKTIGTLPNEEITKEEYDSLMLEFEKRAERTRILFERKRPLELEEVQRMVISDQLNKMEIEDQTSLRMFAYYPTFEEIVGKTVSQGFKFTYQGQMYKVVQSSLLIQEHYTPKTGTESLYTRIDEIHDGDIYDPIPYEGNMALENGKYYTQDNTIYLCTRDTEISVYNSLTELIGIYVELADL